MRVVHLLGIVVGSTALTFVLFMVLPLMQTIAEPPAPDLTVHAARTTNLPPPPPPPEEEPEEDEEPEEEPPELEEETKPLDLSQLELALNPGFGGGLMGGDFTLSLANLAGGEDGVDRLFDFSDLDQKPRVVYQPSPLVEAKLRKRAPATVYVLFVVDRDGRVESPLVQKSTDPAFERAALAAVEKWRFEPGRRKGEAVRFRMRVPITFPEE